jgi:hypothetical protein
MRSPNTNGAVRESMHDLDCGSACQSKCLAQSIARRRDKGGAKAEQGTSRPDNGEQRASRARRAGLIDTCFKIKLANDVKRERERERASSL